MVLVSTAPGNSPKQQADLHQLLPFKTTGKGCDTGRERLLTGDPQPRWQQCAGPEPVQPFTPESRSIRIQNRHQGRPSPTLWPKCGFRQWLRGRGGACTSHACVSTRRQACSRGRPRQPCNEGRTQAYPGPLWGGPHTMLPPKRLQTDSWTHLYLT